MEKPKPSVPTCFVVMPFGGVADDYYVQIYAPAIVDAGLTPVRADEVFSAGSVLQDIVELLSNSSVVVADITENNRNVHYELGLAHALGKPTILVAPQDAKIFFDVGQERFVSFTKDNAFWGAELKSALTRALVGTMKNPSSAIPTAFMHIRPVRVEVDEVVVRLRRIEDLLAEMARRGAARAEPAFSRFQSVLRSLPAAEEEAERLLRTMDKESVRRQLVSDGYGQIMADDAVEAASRRAAAR
jgi:hypothetical protein